MRPTFKESGIANPLQRREDVELSTMFTPQIAEIYERSDEVRLQGKNPMDVECWTPGLIPLLRSGKVKRVGVSRSALPLA